MWQGVAVLVASGLVLLMGASYLLAELLTRPSSHRLPGPHPDAIGLPFEAFTFASHDGKRLMGWLVGADRPGPPVVVLHGYTDEKSSYLEHAQFVYENGYPCLLYDQRGHGESQPARVSLGPLEAWDLLACFETLERMGRGGRLVVWGVSMGAATALLAAARTNQIAGIIAESSYGRLDQVVADTLRVRTRLRYFPKFPLVHFALAIASLRCGTSLLGVDIGGAVDALGERPLLVVSGALDPRMPPEVGEHLLERARGPKRHLVIPEAAHAECWTRGQPDYGRQALGLIEEALEDAPRRRR